MTSEKIRTGKQDRMVSLYQIDPGFYNKILSRSNTTGHSNRISVYCSPGQVPFIWEIQPGKPRNEPEIQVSPQIRFKHMQPGKPRDEPEIQVSFPPPVCGLNMPRPYITSTGPKAYLLRKFRKVKKIKKIKEGLSPVIRNLSVTRPKINSEKVKAYLWKKIRKAKEIKKVKRINLGKLMKGKHRKKSSGDHHHHRGNAKTTTYDSSPYGMCGNDYGFEFSNSPHADDFTPTKTTSSHSSRSSYLSSFSFANAIKPPKLLRFWRHSQKLMKRRSNNKSTKRN